MNTSIDSLKKEIKKIQNTIQVTKDRDELRSLQVKRKALCDALHQKKFKTRQQAIVRKIKKAEAEKPIEDKQPVKIVIKEVPKEITIIKEVPVEVPKEVIVEKEVYVNHGGGIPDTLETDELIALLNQCRQVYINTHSPVKLGDYIKTDDGIGIVKLIQVDEEELTKKGGGIFAKAKRIRMSDGKEGQRYMGKDKRGYKVTEVDVLADISDYIKKPTKKTTKKKK
jgi:hypothetical protein